MTTPEIIQLGTLLMASIAAVFALLCFTRARGRNEPPPLAKFDAMQIVRAETERIRNTVDDSERRLQHSVGESLTSFQNSNVNVVTSLSNNITERTREFGERLERGIAQIDARAETIAKKLEADLERLGTEANENREGLRKLIEEKLDNTAERQLAAGRELREELGGSFRTLGQTVAGTLEQSSLLQKERLAEVGKALQQHAEQHGKAQEALRVTVEGRLDAIRAESAQKLEEMRLTVDEKMQATLETRLDQSFSRVVDQLSKVYEQIGEMKTLASNVGTLNNTLTNVKVRGMFGEVQLALLIDEFLTPDQYVKNAQVSEQGNDRVEYAIKFKVGADGEELLLPVDAKFPREDYEHLVAASEAGDTQLVLKFRKQLENRIKQCARDIKDKYICPPRTTEFAILFLPTESLYAEVLRQPGLFEHLQRECHVTLAGPTTFSAILNAFRMNFHSLALAKKTSEIWRVLSAVRTEFGRYNKVVGSLDRQLRAASNSVENLGRRTRMMDRKLRTVDTLPDDGTAQKLLGLADGEIEIEEDEEIGEDLAAAPDVNGRGETLAPAAE